jgi:hypothetical protein
LIWIKQSAQLLLGQRAVRVTRSTYTVTAMLLPFAHS